MRFAPYILGACALLGLSACRSSEPAAVAPRPSTFGDMRAALAPLAAGEEALAVTAAKVFVLDDGDAILAPGMIVVRNGRVAAVGAPQELPAGFERLDFPAGWATPGLIDLHSHVQTGGWGAVGQLDEHNAHILGHGQ